ncbi:MAG: bifunctional diaminohydroxyphosphoribosylaminopyrimidine deaminase/5-amino-6-(5-phosphoribosylamino)uracil reductase RibD [Balneolaceae bacterium]|nr:bifunctional diaminohydroxyphosphoribosylaminopyrimidine deaminase/5-amino-6-(5-phosphoribosylamino)uracil reductase RibD [Balneolaceae bacterium]
MNDDRFSEADRKWMGLALEIAERGAGYVSPNPMVGCVIVSADGRKIAQGYHERYGEAHAEINALEKVPEPGLLEDATLYVTLEPCAHHGQTPPCAERLAERPFRRVVVAMEDPTPKVQGKGLTRLRKAGMDVEVGLLQEEAEALNEWWLHYQTTHRPFVTLKIAQTADGYIAAPDGDSEWITGEASRRLVHRWRSRYDAVMVGRNTALLDNPRLTVRHVDGRQPRRVVIDGPLELPEELNLFSDQYEEKTIRVTHNRKKYEQEADPMLNMLTSDYFRGETLLVDSREGHTDLEDAFRALGREEITSVLVEAGSGLASALLRRGLVDQLRCFIAPKILGGGTRSVLGLGIDRMSEIRRFRRHTWEPVDQDMLLTAWL